MNENDIKIGETYIPFLNKNCDENFLIVESDGSSRSEYLFDIKDNKAEEYDDYDYTEHYISVPSELRKVRFKSEGIYVYRYKNKKLVLNSIVVPHPAHHLQSLHLRLNLHKGALLFLGKKLNK